MKIELGIRVPLTDIRPGATMYDAKATERDHPVEMSSYGADIVRDANKPSTSFRRETALDHLLRSPSALDPFLEQDKIA